MSMSRCVDCECLLDTDADPEVYREEFFDECLCETCCEARILVLEQKLEDES